MNTVTARFSIFVLNPRLFLDLVSILRRHRIKFRVPMNLDELCLDSELLVVDTEGLNYINKSKISADICREVIIVSSSDEVHNAILSRVFESCSPISIGIDLGKRIAYAVLAGGHLLFYDYVDSLRSVLEVVERLNTAKTRVVLVGIGAEYLRDMPDEVYDLVENEKVTAVYIVEEENTNRAFLPKLFDEDIENLPEDLRAAIVIAIKVYEKHLLAQGKL
ncbi:MAG: hypothetical protein RMI56_06370 [Sulfolobales archaeon]|nr:hypothetical protein [Sulfolobales archaeon]MDW8083399.1 hypothetical protein [Sulfolobales archaeon]